jgi:hypothetical protein
MDEKPTDKPLDDNSYNAEEYERHLAHSDVVLAHQKKLTEQLGRPATLTLLLSAPQEARRKRFQDLPTGVGLPR